MKITFEEACKIHKTIVTVDNFNSIGVSKTMEIYTQALSDVGWTIKDLCEESRNRLLTRINNNK
jgi:hypothetical protein